MQNISQKGARGGVQIVNRRADNSSGDPGKTMLSSQQPHFPRCVNIDPGVKFTSEREAQTNIKER